MLFIMYSVVDYYVLIVQHQKATHILNYYLERMRVEGRLSDEDIINIKDKLEESGMEIDKDASDKDLIVVTGNFNADGRVVKSTSNADASKMTLEMTIKPAATPFASSIFLMGKNDKSGHRIKVSGMILSEYVE